MSRTTGTDPTVPTRRTFLQTAAGIGGIAMTGCLTESSKTTTAAGPAAGDSVTIGINVATSGDFSVQGTQERRGAELAVRHLNEGGGWVGTEQFDDLSGDGLLGKSVETAIRNTDGDAETAESDAEATFDTDDAIMLCGGTAGQAALAQRDVTADRQRIHMVTSAQLDVITGEQCSPYSFREMFPTYSTVLALKNELDERFEGENNTYFQLYSNNTWGQELKTHVETEFADIGWPSNGSREVMVGTQNFTEPLEDAAATDPDVLFLNLPGFDASVAVPQAKKILSEEVTVVVPLLTRRIAETAGSKITDVVGTVPWDPIMARFDPTPLSRTLIESYGSAYRTESDEEAPVPTGPVHVAYSQVMVYAMAVERAGTFDADAVVEELEDASYNVGMSESETMRACDHQANRPVPIVKGRIEGMQKQGYYYELDVIRTDGTYGCDSPPASECSP